MKNKVIRSQKFQARSHLLKTEQFERVYRKGKRLHLSWCILIAMPNNLDYSRLGLSASRKRLGKAIFRNKAKRKARELFRINTDWLPVGYDLVMILKPKLLTEDWHKLQNSYMQALKYLVKRRHL